jgi:hypothetical protein
MHLKCLFLIVIECLMGLREFYSQRHFVKNYVQYRCFVSEVFEHCITICAFHISIQMWVKTGFSVSFLLSEFATNKTLGNILIVGRHSNWRSVNIKCYVLGCLSGDCFSSFHNVAWPHYSWCHILVWYAVGLGHRLAVQTGYLMSIKGNVWQEVMSHSIFGAVFVKHVPEGNLGK